MHYRLAKTLLVIVLILPLLAAPIGAQAEAGTVYIHTVRHGQTLFSIAAVYGVPLSTLKEFNKLTSDTIITGQKLQIPLKQPMVIHVVARHETLTIIAKKYNVLVRDIAWVNDISNINLISVGQKLAIPPAKASTSATATPAPKPTTASTPPVVQEAIIITSPLLNAKVTSPLTVTGWGSGFENTLAVAVLDEAGNVIGKGSATVNAEFGQYGPYSGTITFTMPTKAQVGKVQVYSVSARDGSTDHLNSVMVKFEPAGK